MEKKLVDKIVSLRHPEYAENLEHWDFVHETYEGGKEWFPKHISMYMKEGKKEFEDRVNRAYRFNHTREVVDLIQKYIFKSKVSRKEDAPDEIKKFWKSVTISNLNIDQFMRMVSTEASVFGIIWIFIDTNNVNTRPLSVKEVKENNIRPYAYTKKPSDVLDFSTDENGSLSWILVREYKRDDSDPITSTFKVSERIRLWSKDYYVLFEKKEKDESNEERFEVIETGENALGFVPAFPVTHIVGNFKYCAPGLVDDTAYLDKAIANYLSNLDAIIQDQTFSQLALPAQALLPGDDKYNQLMDMGTKRIFAYDSEGGEPKYLSPDPKQAGVILQVINKIINEIYHTIGLAGERTKQDNAVGVDNSSGVAKAYDFERVNALLSSKAQSLENAENKIIEFVLRVLSIDADSEDLVKYPETFDVYSLFDEFSIAEKLTLIDAPKEVRRNQMKLVIKKMFPTAKEDELKKMTDELSSWPITPDSTAPSSLSPKKFSVAKPKPENRQGEVTK